MNSQSVRIQEDETGLFIEQRDTVIRPRIPIWIREAVEAKSNIHDFCMQLEATKGAKVASDEKSEFAGGEPVEITPISDPPGVVILLDPGSNYKEIWFMQDGNPTLLNLEALGSEPAQVDDSLKVFDLAQFWALAVTGSSSELAKMLEGQVSLADRLDALAKLAELVQKERREARIDSWIQLIDAAIAIAENKTMHPVEKWQILRAIGSRCGQGDVVVSTMISSLGEYLPGKAKASLARLVRALKAYKVVAEKDMKAL